jgi:hypothetical protein
MIDMKGDADVVRHLAAIAAETGRQMHLVTVDGRGGTYNPLSTGTPGQWKNKLIEAEAGAAAGGFTEPHYRRLSERFLLVCCQVLAELVERCAGCPTGTGQEPGTGAITTRRPIEALPIGSARRVRILPIVRHPESGTLTDAATPRVGRPPTGPR